MGSILHFAHDGDTIWGAGVNGKFSAQDHSFRSLDVRAVRGPMTRDFLLRKGVEVPEVYGDPGLLLPHVWNGLREMSEQKRFTLAVVPNLNEIDKYEGHPDLVNPRDPFDQVIQRIAQSERVVGSSLHAIVVAESLGIPASLIHADVEAPFKYDDYYLGTGRTSHQDFPDLCSALTAKVHEPDLEWDAAALLATFPWDLWNDERGA